LNFSRSTIETVFNLCLWIIGIGGASSILLFVCNVIAFSDFLAVIGIIISVMPILFDLSQRRFQRTILRVILGGLSEQYISILKLFNKNERTLEEVAKETELDRAQVQTVISDLFLRGFLEEFARNGKTYFRLSLLGRTTVLLQGSSKGG